MMGKRSSNRMGGSISETHRSSKFRNTASLQRRRLRTRSRLLRVRSKLQNKRKRGGRLYRRGRKVESPPLEYLSREELGPRTRSRPCSAPHATRRNLSRRKAAPCAAAANACGESSPFSSSGARRPPTVHRRTNILATASYYGETRAASLPHSPVRCYPRCGR